MRAGPFLGRKKTFKLPAIDLDHEKELPIDSLLEMPLNAIFNVNIADLKDMVEDCEMLSDEIDIMTKYNKVIFKSSYVYGSEIISEMPVEDIIEGEKSAYSVRYLKLLCNAMVGNNATIRFGSAKPLIAYLKLGDNSRIIYFLAPRVLEEDFEDDFDD